MATVLYRLGRLAFRRRWYVTVLWVVILAGLGFASARAADAPATTFSTPGVESQRAFDLIQQRFPGAQADGAVARVVFVAPDGQKITTGTDRAAVVRLVDEVSGGPQVAGAVNPFQAGAVSEDATTAYSTITYTVQASDLTDTAKNNLSDAAQQARDAGLTVEIGGTALAAEPSAGGVGEILGVAIAAVVLLITFGSLAAAGLPLLTAILGVGISMTAITALAATFGLSDTTGTLATMLGLACGIDYAVFVVFRYREERANGHTTEEAAGLAAGTAGSAVVFAGLTVVIALAGLSVVGIPLLTKMGLCAAGAVVIAVLIALTLVPALLGFWPRAVLSRRYKTTGRRIQGVAGNMGSRWAGFVLRHPWPVLLGTVVGLVVLALPVIGLQLGQSGDEAKSTATTERRAYDDLATAFGPGFNGPLTVVVDLTDSAHPKAAAAMVERRIAAVPGVVSVTPVRFNSTGNTALFTAVPAEAPTSQKTVDLVHTIRDDRPAIETAAPGATFEVTGTTALNIDVAQKVSGALVPYLIVVVGLAVLLLLLVFRSIVIPIKAAVGFLLSVGASFGLVVGLFQQGHLDKLIGVDTTGPVTSFLPIILMAVLFGLAMDYEVFLVSRMREDYVHHRDPIAAVHAGARNAGRVVTAAALIMFSVFASFVTSDSMILKQIAFALAVGVLLDAFVVRMTLVPAVLALTGRAAWWLPRWLDRRLPNLDIEGESLQRHDSRIPDQQVGADSSAPSPHSSTPAQ